MRSMISTEVLILVLSLDTVGWMGVEDDERVSARVGSGGLRVDIPRSVSV